MKRILVLSMSLLCVIGILGQKRVAVSPTTGTADAGVKGALAEAILDGIANSGQYTIVERANFSQIQQEQEFQQSGNVDDEQLAELGRAAGAEFVCVSSVNKIGSNYQINYRLVDVTTGTVVDKSRKTANESTLMDVINAISAEKLFVAANSGNTVKSCGLEIQKKDAGEYNLSKKDQKSVSADGWRLPTVRELKCMCEEKEKIGGFHYGEYWSSESRNGYAVGVRFNSCQETNVQLKASVRYVR